MQNLSLTPRPVARFVSLGIGCAAVLSALCSGARAENIAIVVGVNQYPGLRPGSNLGGCVNDAKLMGEKLGAYKFNVTLLADDQATKQNILSTITALKTKLKPEDHFALYFAGHGTVASNGESVLLTYSSKDASESGDIQNDELYQAVRALPARAKTILLDSCHSGGMVRSVTGLRKAGRFSPRVYIRSARLQRGVGDGGSGEKAWQKVKVNGADDMSDITKNGGVCYFTAALKTQVANETEMEGVRHGVFTFYLASKLTGKKDLWQDVSAAVSTGVLEMTEGEQKPVLAPTGFLSRSVFEGGGSPGPSPTPKPGPNPNPPTPPSPPPAPAMTLDKLYALSAPDPSRVKLLMTPEISPVKVGQQVRFRIEAGMEGYLLLIGRDPSGKLEILYPVQNEVKASKVAVGDVITVPGASDEAMTPDTIGTDGLKAILFTSQEAADALLKSFGGGSMSMKQADKAWKTVKVKAGPFYTSELITRIVGG